MSLRVLILMVIGVVSVPEISGQYSYTLDCEKREFTIVLEEGVEPGDRLSYTLRRFVGPRKQKRINELVNAAPWPPEMLVIADDTSLCQFVNELNVHPKMDLREVHLERVDDLAENGVMMTFVYAKRKKR